MSKIRFLSDNKNYMTRKFPDYVFCMVPWPWFFASLSQISSKMKCINKTAHPNFQFVKYTPALKFGEFWPLINITHTDLQVQRSRPGGWSL